MSHTFSLIGAAMLLCRTLAGQIAPPPITVRNAASQAIATQPDAGLAPGALFSVGLGSPDFVDSVYFLFLLGFPVETIDAAHATVLLSVGGQHAVPLPILASNGLKVVARVPPDVPVGATAAIELKMPLWERTAVATILIKPVSLGFFTRWNTGSGPAFTENSPTNPAMPGQLVTLWGTGLGAAGGVEVVVDGTTVIPSFAGPSSATPGVDHITFRIPDHVRDLCYAPVQVHGRQWTSNVVTLPLAGRGGACVHPLGLTPEALARLDSGGTIPFGEGSLSSAIQPVALIDAGSYANFEGASLDLRMADQRLIDAVSASLQSSAEPSCSTFETPQILFRIPGGADAGESVTLAGPEGRAVVLQKELGYWFSEGTFSPDPTSLPPTQFPAGDWKLQAPGGNDVGPFEFSFALPPPLRWTNREQLGTVDVSQGLTVTWDPSGMRRGDIVTVSITNSGVSVRPTTLQGVQCRAGALDGQLTIPLSLLLNLPLAGSPRGPELTVGVGRSLPAAFTLPSTNGGPSGVSSFTWSRSESRLVRLQFPRRPRNSR